MSYLLNRIIQKIPFDFYQLQSKTKEATKRRFVDRKKMIDIDGVKIAIQLTEKDYDHAYQQVYLHQRDIIGPDDAYDWTKRCIYGDISPEQLTEERINELNEMDMMQNTSIICNPEIVIEMQIIACIIIL